MFAVALDFWWWWLDRVDLSGTWFPNKASSSSAKVDTGMHVSLAKRNRSTVGVVCGIENDFLGSFAEMYRFDE